MMHGLTNLKFKCNNKSFAKDHLSYYTFMFSRSVLAPVKLDIGDFNKYAENPNLVKIGQQYGEFYINT